MGERYKALRTIGTIYKILGGIVAVLTVLIALGICATSVLGGAALNSLSREFGSSSGLGGFFGGALGGFLGALIAILYGGGFSITLYGFGEGVYLLIALEENTRLTAELLRRNSET